jgi:molybdopterin synthase catalytic subunit
VTLTILLFASARESVGAPQVELELNELATVSDLKRELATRYPKMAALLERCRIAVNQDFAADERTLQAPDEIAVIPPVSGGAG